MQFVTLDEIRKALEDRNRAEVSRRTGIHPNTLQRISSDPGHSISFKTYQKLVSYLFQGTQNNKNTQNTQGTK
jgi:DNA-binding Xre family transcriptional regulator